MCYLITPVVAQSVERIVKDNFTGTICGVIIYISIFILVIEVFFDYFNSAWLICYILGFILGRISVREKKQLNKWKILFISMALGCNSMQIYLDYILGHDFQGKLHLIYGRFCDFSHVLLGIALFLSLRDMINLCYKNKYPERAVRVLNVTDDLCFDIYLVHEFFITGTFSLMEIIKYRIINIVLIFIVVLASAVALKMLSRTIQRYIFP